MRYCTILGTNINVTNMQETTDYLTGNLEQLRGSYVCVSNVHTTVMAYRDEAYRAIQNNAAMALPDGKPLSIVSRKRGYTEAQRVPGPDLMPELFRRGQADRPTDQRCETGFYLGGIGSAQAGKVDEPASGKSERGDAWRGRRL